MLTREELLYLSVFLNGIPNQIKYIKCESMSVQVVAFSSVLRSFGLQRGEVVAMYLPMVVELAIAMLACARIGVVHSVVFAGFSAEALAARIVDAKSVRITL